MPHQKASSSSHLKYWKCLDALSPDSSTSRGFLRLKIFEYHSPPENGNKALVQLESVILKHRFWAGLAQTDLI
jgi:hypothetical protein